MAVALETSICFTINNITDEKTHLGKLMIMQAHAQK